MESGVIVMKPVRIAPCSTTGIGLGAGTVFRSDPVDVVLPPDELAPLEPEPDELDPDVCVVEVFGIGQDASNAATSTEPSPVV